MMKSISVISFAYLIFIAHFCDLSGQAEVGWRGVNRSGVFNETGLLRSWPAGGPQLLWTNLELEKGNSSPAFGKDKIYITGNRGSDDILYALSMQGKILWQTVIGRAWTASYPESRATPTVDGDRVYTSSGYGDLACVDGTSGKIIWAGKVSEINKGTYGSWGIAEALIIDGNKIYFTTGGPETMTVALNKNTGETIWRSPSINDKPGYVSPVLVSYAGLKIIINVSMNNVFAVNAANGEILWTIKNDLSTDPDLRRWDLIKCTTPLYNNGMVYITGGYDTGGMMIRLSDDGRGAEVLWKDTILDNHHGGVVLVDGYIYGSNWINNSAGNWCCIDWKTGKKMWEEPWNCKGSVISAEGMLYIYDERRGNVGLLKADPEKFDLVSSFQITEGKSGPFWAHPVINKGILYIRHTNALMAFDIKRK